MYLLYHHLDMKKSIREKIVQFLMDGKSWLREQNDQIDSLGNACGPSSRIWRDEDHAFYQSICIHSSNSKTALLGNIGETMSYATYKKPE